MLNKERINKFSYLILNYQSDRMTLNLIQNIRSFDDESQILVVENSKNNEFLKHNLSSQANIDLIETGRNLGYAGGNNAGLKYLSSKTGTDFVFVCNPDIRLTKLSIDKMKEVIIENENISLLGSQIHDSEGKVQPGAWDSRTLVQDLYGDFSTLRFIFSEKNKTRDPVSLPDLEKFEVISGAFFLARLKSLEKVNFFDERTFLFCEERILAKRLDLIQAERYILNTVNCLHQGSAIIKKNYSSRRHRHLLLLKSRLVYYKYYSNKINFLIYFLSTPFSFFEKVLIDLVTSVVGEFKK